MARMKPLKGSIFFWRGIKVRLEGRADDSHGIFTNIKTGVELRIRISEVTLKNDPKRTDFTALSDARREEAKEKGKAVEGLTDRMITAAEVEERKKKFGVSRATL